MSLAPPAALLRLREATGPAHAALDAALPDGMNTGQVYAHYLQAMLVLAQWQAATPRATLPLAWQPWHDTRRIACLRADLRALGAESFDTRVPDAQDTPLDPGQWIGASYVMEGSALGGMLLLRQAEALAREDVRVSGAVSFLRLHTAQPQRWRRWIAMLDGLDADTTERAVDGARKGFALVHDRLSAEPSRAA